jgi:hypothetical protein
MEQLRFLPVLMFITGVVFVYCGFTNKTPLSVIRGQIGNLNDDGDNYGADPYTTPFSPGGNTNYQGVSYSRPSMSTGPRAYG